MEQNIPTSTSDGESTIVVETAKHEKSVRFKIALLGFFLFLVFVVGLFWLATTPEQTVGLTLSFVAGLSMIFLPCTLPLAFVIVPMTMGKDPKKGLLMAVCFGLGLTITLSFYGVFIAALGKTFGLKSDAEVYAVLLGGIAALIFGLSEIGLFNFKLPSYSGKFPDFIQRQKDYVKTFLLGLLLGNAGVGCPNPAFYLLLGYIASTGDLFNGWFLGFVHGLGRAVPLIFLAILGTLGVNALAGVARHKETVERSMGWMLIIIGAYLFTFGIFGHDWFIASGIHGAWEQFVSNVGGQRFGEVVLKHEHKLVDIPNFIQYGNMFFLGLVALIFLVAFAIKRPPRKTKLTLSVIYLILVVLIGVSTGWTFKIGTNVHINFHESSAQSHGGMMKEHISAYHEEAEVREGVVVNLNVVPLPAQIGTTTKLNFSITKKPENSPVSISDLEIDHEKIMHVIGVRNDLNEFFHIHPDQAYREALQEKDKTTQKVMEVIPGMLTKNHVFAKPGVYKIWSEIKKDGVDYTFGHEKFRVGGSGPSEEKEVDLSRVKKVNGYQISLETKKILVKEKNQTIVLDIHDAAGQEVELENYLGAPAHLTVIKDDLRYLLHTHPVGHEDTHAYYRIWPEALAHGNGEDVHQEENMDKSMTMGGHGTNFQILFPEAGLYKAFAQFRPKTIGLSQEEFLTADFWIKVEEKESFALSPWWVNLTWSSAAIIILSWLVRKYLRAS